MLLSTRALHVRNRINDYEEFIAPPLMNTTKFFETSDLIKDPFSSKSHVASFPKIDGKFLNKTNFLDTNESNRNKRSSIKSSGAKTKFNEIEIVYDDDEEYRSKLFIKDKSSNDIFLLEFKATDVKVIPVYLKHRTFEENKNDKSNQPRSTTIYENKYNNKARRFNQLLKTFKIDNSTDDERISIMSFKKPLFTPRATFAFETKKKSSISDPVSNLKESFIHLIYKNMDFKINPGLMKLKSSTIIDFETEQRQMKLLTDLKMKLPENMKNKAQIVVNYKGDVLKFLFKLSNINCNKLKVTSSIGITAKDESVYIKEFSNISNRAIYIAIPKTNYEYIDVMVKEKQRNRTMSIKKIDPLWLTEQRKKRFKEYYQCRRKNPYDDILDLKIGSSICYEAFNCINKVKGGTLPCSVSDNTYEKWVESLQKTELHHIDDVGGEKFDSIFTDEVPDWDLVLNTK